MIPKKLEEHLELTLNCLPTSFSQLAFFASVRDPYNGRYLHEGWLSLESADKVHEVLRRLHQEVFELVLRLPVRLLCGELRRYLESLSESREETVRLWQELESYREMTPQGAPGLSRELFVSQMRTALAVLLSAPDWPQIPARSSSQHQPLVPQFQRHLDN
jgi:hypothetical protein